MVKYDMSDIANDTLPVPDGMSIRETYGNVIRGKMKFDIVRNVLYIKFFLRDFCFFI